MNFSTNKIKKKTTDHIENVYSDNCSLSKTNDLLFKLVGISIYFNLKEYSSEYITIN